MFFKKPKRDIQRIFIHCSDSDYDHHDDITVIRKWHINENGWNDVGYHYFIKRDGTIQNGRDIEKTPSSQKGNNLKTISICLHGSKIFSKKQLESLKNFCNQLNWIYNGKISFHGHNEVSKKSCPVFDYVSVLNLNMRGYIRSKL